MLTESMIPLCRTFLDRNCLVRRVETHARFIARGIQLVIFISAGLLAFLLRFDFTIPPEFRQHLLAGLVVWTASKVVVFHLLGLYRGWWRYASIRDVLRLLAANFLGSALGCVLLLSFGPKPFPRSLYILDFLICLITTIGARFLVRVAYEYSKTAASSKQKRAIIYGAGDAGVMLLREILQNPSLNYDVIGFVDDDPAKTRNFIHRKEVLGCGAELKSIVTSRGIETVLIALPSATRAEMTAILNNCEGAGISFKTIPGLGELIEGEGLATKIRDVAVEDVLGRKPARLEHDEISAKITGKVVLVTGGAGSIGSELCRQIARFNPSAIVAFDMGETALFYIERDMRARFPEVPFYPEIGNILDRNHFTSVLHRFKPAMVFHAAAYKHVPMMEAHIFQAVENNVFGTWNVATLSAKQGVEDFVMISSDKAVRPTSVMGATKRTAELLIISLQNQSTKFLSVRFGNVLGSSGSVIPIFKQQIAAGGPITVTHPDMRRYFMTIPEAAQLVLQASAIGKGGEIFVLDMGEPVKIVDLARNLILLSGLHPGKDIKIEFTGIRPGEKLYEELNLLDEDMQPTHHEKIKIFSCNGLPAAGMEHFMETLQDICNRRNLSELVLLFKDLISEYSPSASVLERALIPRDQSTNQA
jgi:FlaA1/EpsC-like NDP-sugar epimerase